MKLGFAGTPAFAVPALEALAARHSIAAVYTQPDRGSGRGRRLHEGPVKACAAALGIEVRQPPKFNGPETLGALAALQLDALIVVAYGMLLPPAALALPRLGCLNIHASLLPRWRGAAPIQRAILEGDAETGVTIMQMDAGLDTGATLSACATPIGGTDTAESLHDRLSRLGAGLIVETLDALDQGALTPRPQSQGGATYASKIDKAEAAIDWREDAGRIERRVRAFFPWPIAETRAGGAQLRILEARALEGGAGSESETGRILGTQGGGIDVQCGRGILRIERLQLAGRKPLKVREFLQGSPLPARFGS